MPWHTTATPMTSLRKCGPTTRTNTASMLACLPLSLRNERLNPPDRFRIRSGLKWIEPAMAGEPEQHSTITVPEIARRLDVCEETVYGRRCAELGPARNA